MLQQSLGESESRERFEEWCQHLVQDLEYERVKFLEGLQNEQVCSLSVVAEQMWEDPNHWARMAREEAMLPRQVPPPLEPEPESKGKWHSCGLREGVRLAYMFAQQKLRGPSGPSPVDRHGLNRDEIAVLHLYTQSSPGSVLLYNSLNSALRLQHHEVLRPFFPLIRLL